LAIHGDDLAVATHGRAFWILDDITPLRQARDAVKAEGSWFYRPATATRIDNDSFVGSPLPPEEPTAKNPPDGAVIDYYLKTAAQHINLEIVNEKQNVVCTFSSDDPREQQPAARPIPERWFPKPEILETTPGMHRFVWNLAWNNPGAKTADEPSEDEYRPPRPPRAIPGTYQARLTIDKRTFTQPLKIVMDPRSPATARDLEQQLELSRQIFAEAISSRHTLAEIRSVQRQSSELQQKLAANQADLKSAVTQLESEIGRILNGNEDLTNKVVGLGNASKGLASALNAVESGDRAVPSQAIALYEESSQALKLRLADWNHVKTNWLPQLNQHLRQNNMTPIAITEIVEQVDAE
jgi:hypothetical protein